MPAVPTSTYRLQIRAGFTLSDAAAVLDYLSDLGVGAVYCSPLLQSTVGSDHGYDTTDPAIIDLDRGGEPGWAELSAAAERAGLMRVVDIVPNHLGVSAPAENPYWWDVLRLGPDSAYASWFDIDWTPRGGTDDGKTGRLLVPILGEDDPELSIEDGELHYFEHRFPLAPGSWSQGDDPAEVHARQHYELVHYARGNSELNYRRFFAVTTLAGVRQEDRAVFDATHARIADWVAEGVDGLRIDHPDGLVDPAGYLEWLRALAPDAWITVEKILEPGEKLPDWPVQGTTGYDAMREVNGIFVDPDAAAQFTELYQRMTGDTLTGADHVEQGKQMVVSELLPAEVARIARLAPEIDGAGAAVAQTAVAFEVYRSYLPDGAADLDHALALAEQRHPELADTLEDVSPRLHDAGDEMALRLQQLSGATMAKGTEDTAFYRYARFVALNEVGGNPDIFGIGLEEFHQLMAVREAAQPQSMTSLSTHDTKRGEDVRARLAALAEVPEDWAEFAELFLARTTITSRPFAYFLAQTLVGAGPIERERMHAYAEKAMREASVDTHYTDVNATFEDAVQAAVDLAYDDAELRGAWDELVTRLSWPGWSNSLGQKLVQLTMPGIPDVYQGTEVWEDSLVDPDNRRPVDFAAHRRLLADLVSPPPIDDSGAAKLWLTSRTLRLRRDSPERFTGYTPVTTDGPAARHLVAFERSGVLTVATRLPITLGRTGGWSGETLALGGWVEDALTGRTYDGDALVSDLLEVYPVALLVRR